jgi:hypothetical protein
MNESTYMRTLNAISPEFMKLCQKIQLQIVSDRKCELSNELKRQLNPYHSELLRVC